MTAKVNKNDKPHYNWQDRPPRLHDMPYNTNWKDGKPQVEKPKIAQSQDTPDPLKGKTINNIENTPWCIACDGPHSPHQCAVAQALEESMRPEAELDINMFETIIESDEESMQSECSDVLDNERLVRGQLALGWHPTLNVVTIEDEEVHLRRPSEEEVKNLTKAAIAKARHNYNLRSTKRDTDQGEPGSMFVKEVTKKGASNSVTATVKVSQEKEEQVKDLPKTTDAKNAGDVQKVEIIKKGQG